MEDRAYQIELEGQVYAARDAGARHVLMRLDTGGGKTHIVANTERKHNGPSAIIAHRQELVGQLSLTLARHGLVHDVIAAQKTRGIIAAMHMQEFGRSFYAPGAPSKVASVDTLLRADLGSWNAQVTKWTVDEAHHVVKDNKWHTVLERFTHPQCWGLGPTATPQRADGKGLGAHADGVFHAMVQGPPMRWLINAGFLTDYDIVCPLSDMELLEDVGSTGDWSAKQLKEASERSHIVGDVVAGYLRFAAGRLGITFTTDVATARKMAEAYRAAGVPAEAVTGDTDPIYRRQVFARFERREILQIVAVDIVSEGTDIPALEVVSFARPSQSLGLYMQQFGRSLRPMQGKGKALVIDHVGNVIRHQGPPDKPRAWSLDARERRGTGDGIPLTICVACFRPYERIYRECPYCGARPMPAIGGRSGPQQVDGDLALMDPLTLHALRQAANVPSLEDYQRNMVANGARPEWVGANGRRHEARLEALSTLRNAMEIFGGYSRAAGMTDEQIQRKFYLLFGIDVLTAQGSTRDDALRLTERILMNVR